MNSNLDNLKRELKYIQKMLEQTTQAVEKAIISDSISEQVIDKRLGDILEKMESACIASRCVIEKYRIMKPFNENYKREKSFQMLWEA